VPVEGVGEWGAEEICGRRGEEVKGDCRLKLHSNRLHDLYCSPNVSPVIGSRKMGWAGRVARVGERRGAYRVLVLVW
jgi:hypothetical protein